MTGSRVSPEKLKRNLRAAGNSRKKPTDAPAINAPREENKKSDVDILVEFEKGRSLLDLSGLTIELEELFGRNVDIVTYKSIHPLLKDRILAEQKAII